MSPHVPALRDPLRLGPSIDVRNRFAATAHGRGAVVDGLPGAEDAAYWEGVAAGGAGLCILGGNVISTSSTARGRMYTEAWRDEARTGLALRAAAVKRHGAVPILQLLHLGRETLGAEQYGHAVAPAAVRSPREPVRPRALEPDEVDGIIAGFQAASEQATVAGFDGVELHGSHGYLIAQFLSPVTNPDATLDERVAPVIRMAEVVRGAIGPDGILGLRLGIGDAQDAGLTHEDAAGVLARLDPFLNYVNLTVGMRLDYVRDMATARPPLLDDIAALRTLTARPLLVSHGFRDGAAMQDALDAGADLVGMARALIADPALPNKVLGGAEDAIRPCVACNEDCRTFDPALLCAVNPALAPPGLARRPGTPLVRGVLPAAPRRIGVVGAGPGGLEAAVALGRHGDCQVVLWERSGDVGGALAIAGFAPHRSGWLRLVDYHRRRLAATGVDVRLGAEPDDADLADLDAVIVATGSVEVLPQGIGAPALTTSAALLAGPGALAGCEHVVVVDNGFAWWPSVSAVELARGAGVSTVTVVTPGASFATGIPPESRVQLTPRLRGMDVRVRAFTLLDAVGDHGASVRSTLTGTVEDLAADAVIVVGERRSRDWAALAASAPCALIVGDATVPRRAAHAISEGSAAAGLVLAGAVVPV